MMRQEISAHVTTHPESESSMPAIKYLILRRILPVLSAVALLAGLVPRYPAYASAQAIAAGHTATPLLDGRILIAVDDVTLLFAPGSLRSENGPAMASPRAQHTAALLRSGEVLVAGGTVSGQGYVATAERFDPATNQWRDAASMHFARAGHTATRLMDGRLLIVGGEGDLFEASGSVERYDPEQDRWESMPSLATPRQGHTATLLPDGRVMVIGGRNDNDTTGSIEIFSPATQQWSAASFYLRTSRHDHTATLRGDGTILVAGGVGASGEALVSVEIVDPSGGVTAGPALASGRTGHSATLLPDGSLLIAGGESATTLDTVEVLAPAAAAWASADVLSAPRTGHTATLAPGGGVLIAGGNQAGGAVEWITAPVGVWQPRAGLAVARQSHTATLLLDGTVLVAGGSFNGAMALAERYDPAGDRWRTAGPLQQSRRGHTATLLADGTVLAIGGAGMIDDAIVVLASMERYDPAADGWQAAPPMSAARIGHTTTLLDDGSVLVVGGDQTPAIREDTFVVSASAERFDPAYNQWIAQPGSAGARSDHTATLLPDGRVLVVGGVGAGLTAASAAEVYDPVAKQWRPTAAMHALRAHHTATLLPDGRVLVAGGLDPASESFTVLDSAELFDPATDTWTLAAAMPSPRQFHGAVLLPTGEVVLIGGETTGGAMASDAALYDPRTDHWRASPGGDDGRVLHTATLLLDGRVLVTGGFRYTSFETLSEVVGYGASTVDPRPVLASAVLDAQARVFLQGNNFWPAISASSDDTRQSAANAPVVQLRHLDSERQVWPGQAAGTLFATTAITSTRIVSAPALLNGPVIATVFVNGLASNARFLSTASPSPPEDALLYLPLIRR